MFKFKGGRARVVTVGALLLLAAALVLLVALPAIKSRREQAFRDSG